MLNGELFRDVCVCTYIWFSIYTYTSFLCQLRRPRNNEITELKSVPGTLTLIFNIISQTKQKNSGKPAEMDNSKPGTANIEDEAGIYRK